MISLPSSSSLSLPCDNQKDVAVRVGLTSLSSNLFSGGQFFESDPMSLYLSRLPCEDNDDDSCSITIILQREYSTDFNQRNLEEKSFTTTCQEDDYSIHSYLCPDGFNYTVSCNGTAETFQSICPNKTTTAPSCHILDESGRFSSDSSCTRISFTDATVTCRCSLNSIQRRERRGRRRRLGSSNNSTIIGEDEVDVNYVSMLGEISGDFRTTVSSVTDLNAATVEKGWQALMVIGSLFTAILIALIFSYRADQQNKKIEAIEAKNLQSRLFPVKTLNNNTNGTNIDSPTATATDVLQLAELSLPNMLSSKPFYQKVKEELKRHHRYLGIIFHFSEKFPRILRVVSLATNIIIMLFIQSLTYNLAKGDDGSCQQYSTQEECLLPSSHYATGTSKCYWKPSTSSSSSSSSSRHQCHYVQPDNSIEVILFVAIFSALVSTPIAIFADWIIVHILAAPTLQSIGSRKASKIMNLHQLTPANNNNDRSSGLSIVPGQHNPQHHNPRNLEALLSRSSSSILEGYMVDIHRKMKQEQIQLDISLEFQKLTKEIQNYRLRLINPNE
jgi:hypothetical protein